MVNVRVINPEKYNTPNNNEDYNLYETYGFAFDDGSICLITDECDILWLHNCSDEILITHFDEIHNIDITIGEFLRMEDYKPNVTKVFLNKEDFILTCSYFKDDD